MSLSARTRFDVLKRDGFACQYCGGRAPDVALHVDHIKPRIDGGDDSPGNLITACGTCNWGKGIGEVVQDQTCCICDKPGQPGMFFSLRVHVPPQELITTEEELWDAEYAPHFVCGDCTTLGVRYLQWINKVPSLHDVFWRRLAEVVVYG